MSVAYRVTMDAAQEVGTGSTSPATGLGTVVFDDAAVTAQYSIRVTGLDFGPVRGLSAQTSGTLDDVTGFHVHNAVRGQNGPVAFGQFGPAQDADDLVVTTYGDGSTTVGGIWETSDPASSSIASFAATLNATAIGSDAPLYFNVHTNQFPGGAIRGQWVAIANDLDNEVAGTDRDDWLPGLAGDDTLVGGLGADTLDGAAGRDWASYGAAAAGVIVRLDTGAGYTGEAAGDVLLRVENLLGSSHGDYLIGDAAANRIETGAGDDSLRGGVGADTLNGGTGVDGANYGSAAAGVTVRLDSGLGYTGEAAGDVLTSIENLAGSVFADILIGDGGNNRLEGSGGGDDLRGQGGGDTLEGGTGDDTLAGGAGGDFLVGGSGVDAASYAGASSGVTVRLDSVIDNTGEAAGDSYSGVEWVVGTAHADVLAGDATGNVLQGGAGADELYGLGGDDTLIGESGADEMYGSDGDDTLIGGFGAELMDGGSGADVVSYQASASEVIARLDSGVGYLGTALRDTYVDVEALVGSSFDDTLIGDADANSLSGGPGQDDLRGWDGDDTLEGGRGADTLEGGAGTDTASYAGAASGGVHARLASGLGYIGDAAGDTYIGIEDLLGSAFSDTLAGDDSGNLLEGGEGNDALAGRGGDDTLVGGPGADRMDGGGTFGGAGGGFDVVSYATANAGVVASLFADGTSGSGDAAGDVLTYVEGLIGSTYADYLSARPRGGGSVDAGALLEGGSGDDSLIGYAEDDTLQGGADSDILDGYLGDDTLEGGAGDDVLHGDGMQGSVRVGADLLDGGAGIDTATYELHPGSHPGGVHVRLDTGLGYAGQASGDRLISVENLIGSHFPDTLVGDDGANVLDGRLAGTGNFNDTDNFNELFGLGGDDTLKAGGRDRDFMDGGAGVDTGSYDVKSAWGVGVRLDTGLGYAGSALGDTLASVENLIGSNGPDTLIGDVGANVLAGENWADDLRGLEGDDVLVPGPGADSLDGGDGVDTVSYEPSRLGVIARLDSGLGYLGDAVRDSFAGVENLTGSAHDDILIGNAGGNALAGGAGDDDLRGWNGPDMLAGGVGDDILWGGSSNDRFAIGDDAGRDRITDFAGGSGLGDVVDLSGNGSLNSFADVQAAASQVGADTAIDLGGGSTLTLESFTASNLVADDFAF